MNAATVQERTARSLDLDQNDKQHQTARNPTSAIQDLMRAASLGSALSSFARSRHRAAGAKS